MASGSKRGNGYTFFFFLIPPAFRQITDPKPAKKFSALLMFTHYAIVFASLLLTFKTLATPPCNIGPKTLTFATANPCVLPPNKYKNWIYFTFQIVMMMMIHIFPVQMNQP